MRHIPLLIAILAIALLSGRPVAAGISVKVEGDVAAGGAGQEIVLYQASYALVIGIDRYTNGWPSLNNAVHDAELVAEGLREIGFDVTVATDLGSDDLRRTLKEFLIRKGAEPDARLFVWYAGHGHSEHGEGFLVPADAPLPADPDFALVSLPMRDVGTMVRLARAKHVLAVFDSCFAGTIFESRGAPPPPAITRATLLPVRQFLSAGEADQTVSDDGSFRELFLRAIKGEDGSDANGDGYVTGSELGSFLADRVTNLTHGAQTPRYGKMLDVNYDRGDFVFVLPQQVAEPAPPTEPAAAETASGDSKATEAAYEMAFWDAIKNSGVIADYEAYLQAYPTGRFVPLANARIATLRAADPNAPASSVAAEPAPEAASAEAPAVETPPEPEAQTIASATVTEPVPEPAAPEPVAPEPVQPELVAMDEHWVALRSANVRAGPDQTAARIARLAVGDPAHITGKVVDTPWYAVALADGRSGYVHADLVGPALPAAAAIQSSAPDEGGEATFSADNPFATSTPTGSGTATADPDNPFATTGGSNP